MGEYTNIALVYWSTNPQFLHPFLSQLILEWESTQWVASFLVSKPHPVVPPLLPLWTIPVGTCLTAIILLHQIDLKINAYKLSINRMAIIEQKASYLFLFFEKSKSIDFE